MARRINKAAVTLEVGESLRDLAKRLASIDEYSGDARERELRLIGMSVAPLTQQLKLVIDSCRAVDGSYPNYPGLRKAVKEAGEEVYNLRSQLGAMPLDTLSTDPQAIANEFAVIGQKLKLVKFAPPLREDPSPTWQTHPSTSEP
jgi:hypothetical protein